MIRFYSLLFLGFLILSCEEELKFPATPSIELVSMSKNHLQQNFLVTTDSIIFNIGFVDGDGDFGFNTTDTSKIYFIDKRLNFEYSFRIPNINATGTRGIEGEIKIKTSTVCCIFPDGDIPCSIRNDYPTDTLTYDIYIIDLAGNKSNVLESPPIFVQCN